MIDPVSAGITAGATLLSNLLTSSAQAEEARKRRLFEMRQQAQQQEQAGVNQLAQGQSGAFANLMANYTGLLGR